MHKRKDGTSFPVEVMISTDASLGKPLIVANCRDASDKEREVQLAQARLQAEVSALNRIFFFFFFNSSIRIISRWLIKLFYRRQVKLSLHFFR